MTNDQYHLPNLSSRTAIITGGNSGLGAKTALELARKGCDVTITCRSLAKGQAAVSSIQAQLVDIADAGNVCCGVCDLSDLQSVQNFVIDYKQRHDKLDIFLANAGVSTVVVEGGNHTLTKDGQEFMMQANYLGHFGLIYGLYELLLKSDAPRVVSCNTAFYVVQFMSNPIDLSDFNWSQRASKDEFHIYQAYYQSRLAQQLMTLHLNKRFEQDGKKNFAAVCMSPGLTQRPNQKNTNDNLPILQMLRMSVEEGVKTHLRAVVGEDVKPNDFLEPHRWLLLFGGPATYSLLGSRRGGDEDAAEKLWNHSKNIFDDLLEKE